jgi:iron only hydrogenase large subunit-like protein
MGVNHSVVLDTVRCTGCTNCIKQCPTQAIRVRDGKAAIIESRCIDCGECIRICPHYAKSAQIDTLESIRRFRYPVALIAPTFYGQFPSSVRFEEILGGVLSLGFHRAADVAVGAEIATGCVSRYMEEHSRPRPLISTACPAVTRLIRLKFPELTEHFVPLAQPMRITAQIVRERMIKEGYPKRDIGVFFISPCAAKASAVRNPIGFDLSEVDGVIGINQVYWKVFSNIKNERPKPVESEAGPAGIGWALIGGESQLLQNCHKVAVDGLSNVIQLMEGVVMGRVKGIEFIEALACVGGCVGGPLTIENPFVAKALIQEWTKGSRKMKISMDDCDWRKYQWTTPTETQTPFLLDENPEVAMLKMEAIDDLVKGLPGLDCGACGSPTCRALAEDVVQDHSSMVDCIFLLKQNMSELAEAMFNLSRKIPASISNKKSE